MLRTIGAELRANPAKPAIAPSIMKIRENPTTKLRVWKNIGTLLLTAMGSSISGPHILARYTGTNGNTQGVRKANSPVLKATRSDTCSIPYQ